MLPYPESPAIFDQISCGHSTSEDEESIQENSGRHSDIILFSENNADDFEQGDRRTRLLSGHRSDL